MSTSSKNPSKDKKQSLNIKQLLSNMLWSFKILGSISKRDTVLLLASGILYRVVTPVMSYFSARIIDTMIELPLDEIESILNEQIIKSLFVLFFAVALTHFIRNFARKANRYIEKRKFQDYHIKLFQLRVNKIISDLDIQQIEDPKVADIVQQSRENIYNIIFFAINSTSLASRLISLIVTLGISLSISWQLTLLIALSVIPFAVIYYKFIKSIWTWLKDTAEDRRTHRSLASDLNEYRFQPEHKISGSNERIFHLANHKLKDVRGKFLRIFRNRLQWEFIDNLIYLFVTLTIQISLLGMIIAGKISIGSFTFYESNFHRFTSDLSGLIANLIDLIDRGVLVNYLRELMELENIIKSGNKKIKPSEGITIEFKNVSFKYPDSEDFVLEDINLTIKKGQEVAVVGENGAGKSTLIRLILRFYDPTKGKILINGIDLKDLDLYDYYQHIAALFQDFNQYGALTLEDNIKIGASNFSTKHEKDSESLRNALVQSKAKGFADKLKKGLQTPLSKQFSNGTELSKGQWQKVALARALYRNSQMLILDEPTASIDANSEKVIFNNIYKTCKDKTVILISHRFSSVRNAQKIFVFKDGEIAESGTHEKLMRKNGAYAKSFKMQKKGYE